ncbi:phosphatase [Streptococcus pneumoniae]|nr:phosphatase [Streptococcus pneumoniae]
MTSITAIFFDLDGTLVDSSIGIHNAFTYTFKELGVPSPDAKTIRGFMGPPLESSFATCLSKDQISEAVQIYRSYYKAKGIYEAQLFPQIIDLLEELSSSYPLYITTTKNTLLLKTWQKTWKSIISLMAFMVLALKHPIRQMSFTKPCRHIN